MNQKIAQLALVVSEYDEAIAFYTQKLQFDLLEDTRLSDTKRWVRVAPKGASDCALLLAKAADEEQQAALEIRREGEFFCF